LKLKCDEPLSNVAFNFNLRRYTLAAHAILLHSQAATSASSASSSASSSAAAAAAAAASEVRRLECALAGEHAAARTLRRHIESLDDTAAEVNASADDLARRGVHLAEAER
jgi:hypothetical protein